MRIITNSILCLTIACSVCGCVLDETEMHKLAPDPNNAVYCPAKTTSDNADAERILSYIQFTSNDNSDEIAICTKKDCSSKTDCCGLTGKQAELYYLAFKYAICPQDMRCMTNNNTKEHYCEMKETECTGDFVKCNNECYNIKTDNMNCGECNSPCETKHIPNSKTVACMEGECTAIYCIDRYHVNKQTNECVPDNIESCGGTDCTKTPGWLSGICDEDTCVADQCISGYHVYNQPDDNGTHLPCEEDNAARCGEPPVTCESGEGIESMGCEEGYCIIAKCKEGYHLSRDKDRCEFNTASACGAYNKDCYSDPTWGNGDDVYDDIDGFCDDDLNCYANTCQKGYHPFNQNVNSVFIPCQIDDANNCGKTNNKCPESAPLCANGQCVQKCTPDLKLCGTECVNLNTNINYCGSCDNRCTQGDNVNTTCNGTCSTPCHEGYGDCDNDLKSNGCESSYKDRHLVSCGTCENNYADCKNETNIDCNTHLPTKHWSKCNQCANGYKNCDSDSDCEINLQAMHWTDCKVCADGFQNCDKTSPDCETDLKSMHWSDCSKKCKSGFENCDGDDSNGCEIELATYGLKACKTCADGYTKCGNYVNNTKIASCLKEGKNWKKTALSFKDHCKKACNNKTSSVTIDIDYNYYVIKTSICKPAKTCNITFDYEEYDDFYEEYYEHYNSSCK